MEPTYGSYDIDSVRGIDTLREKLSEIENAPDADSRAEILSDVLLNGHKGSSGYLTFGNNKVSTNTGIFNMNSATDCPNADTSVDNQSDTGVCQVPWDACYAHKAENMYKHALPKRRRQEYLWDNVTAMDFANALLRVKERKRSAFENLRVSEAGDFRHNSDIAKWDAIAKLVGDSINVYTYSASYKLNWELAEHFVVNESVSFAEYGDRNFAAFENIEDIPDDYVLCPFEAAKINGIPNEDRPKCGDCMMCVEPNEKQSRNVGIVIH